AGLPVFCSDIPALRELGRSDVHFFAPDADPTRLAGQIAAALAKNTSYGLRKRVLADFTWQGIYENRIMPLLEKD
ncbi:MAG TPA: hypothetical protein VMJ64_16615, partial [Anaerolineales bacterium]|nr:hypothetical protein [Anaerolineales bacterium]